MTRKEKGKILLWSGAAVVVLFHALLPSLIGLVMFFYGIDTIRRENKKAKSAK